MVPASSVAQSQAGPVRGGAGHEAGRPFGGGWRRPAGGRGLGWRGSPAGWGEGERSRGLPAGPAAGPGVGGGLRVRSGLTAGVGALTGACLPVLCSGRGGTGPLFGVDSAFPVWLVKLRQVWRRLLEELSPDLPPAGAI